MIVTCARCEQPIEDIADAMVEIVSRYGTYPVDRNNTVAHSIHRTCITDGVGYYVTYWELLSHGLYGVSPNGTGWIDHLFIKVWWHPEFSEVLHIAHDKAVELREVKQRNAAALERALRRTRRRPPPTPRNPRNITSAMRTYILERDDFRCRRCGASANDARLEIDHVVPVCRGGTAAPSNLQTLCAPCNAGKAGREPHDHDLNVAGAR